MREFVESCWKIVKAGLFIILSCFLVGLAYGACILGAEVTHRLLGGAR